LILYSDIPVGWFAKLDLRTVHFLNLRSLTLNQHIFHHQRQINWDASHATLQDLFLDRCSILYQIGHTVPNFLDPEGYPTSMELCSTGYSSRVIRYLGSDHPADLADSSNFSRLQQFNFIASCWYDIFPRFAEELPKSRTSKLGSSS
jgi:hypothetical protein